MSGLGLAASPPEPAGEAVVHGAVKAYAARMTGPKPRRSLMTLARTRSSHKATAPGSYHLLKALGDGSGRAAVLSILGGHSGRVDLAARDELGRTALHLAAARGDCVLVGHLLEAGANAEATAASGLTALLVASRAGYLDLVDVLLSSSRHEGLEAKDRHGRTALHCAAWRGHASVVRRLLEVGADAEVSDRLSGSVLKAAASSVRPIIQAAVDAGPARRMANLRWHRAGRRHLVMWRRAALACAIPEA